MNNLYNQLNQNQGQPSQNNIHQLIQMAKNGVNPLQLLGNNPQYSNIIQLLNKGITPKQLFLNMSQQKGINPNNIISMLK